VKGQLQPGVAGPHHLDADPDPAFYSDADPDPTFTLMQIRIRNLSIRGGSRSYRSLFSRFGPSMLQNDPLRPALFHFYADPAFHFDVDPDPAFQFNADPASQNDAAPCGFGSATLLQPVPDLDLTDTDPDSAEFDPQNNGSEPHSKLQKM
jgi:hypothetical protein